MARGTSLIDTIRVRVTDPYGEKKARDLYHLIVYAGGFYRLSSLLGYRRTNPGEWRRDGQLPTMAALLVDSCPELRLLWTSTSLRPDVSTAQWETVHRDPMYKARLDKQNEFLSSRRYWDGSPAYTLYHLSVLKKPGMDQFIPNDVFE